MTVLHFLYRMELKYEKHIGRCYFTIKCLPREDDRQHVLNTELFVLPKTTYSFGEDSFGNRQIYGCEHEDHNLFVFQISGDVEILQTDYEEKNRQEVTGLFQVPHGKCIPGGELLNYFHSLDFKECETSFQVCEKLMHGLHQDFSYVPGTTDVNTTAEEAWKQGKGVCQDYAHIYVTLLRLAGIPARYVCGLIIGEGASHAWAEALIDGFWVPFDPTNDCLVWDHYIKLGHGRDAADCAINRGLMWNGGAQSQDISVLVEKRDQ